MTDLERAHRKLRNAYSLLADAAGLLRPQDPHRADEITRVAVLVVENIDPLLAKTVERSL